MTQLGKGRGFRIEQVRKPCRIESCPHPSKARGLCNTHSARERNGLPLDTPIRPRSSATVTKTHRLIAEMITRQTAPIEPQEVFDIYQRMNEAMFHIDDLDAEEALVMVVCGRGDVKYPGSAADAERYEQERQLEELRELQAA